MPVMFNVSEIYSLSSSNFNIGKLLRLREEIMTPINTIIYMLTTTADVGNNILSPIRKKGFSVPLAVQL